MWSCWIPMVFWNLGEWFKKFPSFILPLTMTTSNATTTTTSQQQCHGHTHQCHSVIPILFIYNLHGALHIDKAVWKCHRMLQTDMICECYGLPSLKSSRFKFFWWCNFGTANGCKLGPRSSWTPSNSRKSLVPIQTKNVDFGPNSWGPIQTKKWQNSKLPRARVWTRLSRCQKNAVSRHNCSGWAGHFGQKNI